MTASQFTVAVLLALGAAGLLVAGLYGALRRRRLSSSSIESGTAVARAASYAALALALAFAVFIGPAGIATLIAFIGVVGLLEWASVAKLPGHHRLVMVLADVVLVAAIYAQGSAAAAWLVGGLVLVGALWPVIRSDTQRAVRDLGMAAIGFVFVAVTLAHGVALTFDHPVAGPTLFAALALGCAGSDVGAFIVGRRFGHTKLAPTLSPNKTRAGVVGNFIGGAIGLLPLSVALIPLLAQEGIGAAYVLLLVPIVAIGAVWGDLFKSAAKREAGVKDFGAWLPGFGGILDRVDSLLMTLPLAYWTLRALAAAGLA